MAIALNITLDGEAARRLPAMAARAADLSRPLNRLGLWHQRKAGRILRTGERGVQARNPAGLAASISYRTAANTLAVGSNKAYAAAQQFGGDITSNRPGGYLAIPIADNLAARGNPRFKSPRDVEGGFFFVSDGKLFFARELGGRKRPKRPKIRNAKGLQKEAFASAARPEIELLFLLVRRVTLKPGRYVSHDVSDQEVWERYAADWIKHGK